MPSSVGGKGGRKIGRDLKKPTYARYVNERRREANRIKRLNKHVKQFRKDTVSLRALKRAMG